MRGSYNGDEPASCSLPNSNTTRMRGSYNKALYGKDIKITKLTNASVN